LVENQFPMNIKPCRGDIKSQLNNLDSRPFAAKWSGQSVPSPVCGKVRMGAYNCCYILAGRDPGSYSPMQCNLRINQKNGENNNLFISRKVHYDGKVLSAQSFKKSLMIFSHCVLIFTCNSFNTFHQSPICEPVFYFYHNYKTLILRVRCVLA
jgi:hypothetical protein